MKKISILIPTYNEQENVVALSEELVKLFASDLPSYDYEIIFIDNDSKDNTRTLLSNLCANNKKIKAIFNAKNFGQNNSPYYGLCQTTGDCAILLCADFQDPLSMIPQFVHEWENGYKIVSAIKTKSKESRVMFFLRSCYYRLIQNMSDIEQIEHFTGFGLYDKSFIDVMRALKDPMPFLRGIVAELGYQRKSIAYTQDERRAGKSSNNFFRLYDVAMLGFTSYTKVGLRLATILGFMFSALSMSVALVYLILKLIFWNDFALGTAPILIGMFLLGAIQLFFIGLLGEYVLAMNLRSMNRPLVIEERRLNFEADNKSCSCPR